MRAGHQGTGPGALTPDGCAVELYSRLSLGDGPDIIASAVPAGAHILELGSGVGRMTHPLRERGFTVTAVDEFPEMLERVRGARTICAPIEDLDLDETFDVVLLASFLVHTADTGAVRGGAGGVGARGGPVSDGGPDMGAGRARDLITDTARTSEASAREHRERRRTGRERHRVLAQIGVQER